MHPRWESQRFSEILDRALEASGLTQRELADPTGVSHSQISRWKAGLHRPDFDNVRALAVALHRLAPHLGNLSALLLAAAGYAETEFQPLPRGFRELVESGPGSDEDKRRVIGLMEGTITSRGEDGSSSERPPDESNPQAG